MVKAILAHVGWAVSQFGREPGLCYGILRAVGGVIMVYKNILRPILFRFNGETAHHLAMVGLRTASAIPGCTSLMHRVMAPRRTKTVEVGGVLFENRLGVAAGWVKDGDALPAIWGLGFGFAEIGTVTARPWAGNPKPRVQRMVASEGMINRMGLPSKGWRAVRARIESQRRRIPLLINVGKTADPQIHGDEAIADIVETVNGMAPVADMLVLNLSCPNVPDGRDFENDPEMMRGLLDAVMNALARKKKLLIKLSPDKTPADLAAIVDVAMSCGVDGFVATNTTKGREGLTEQEVLMGARGGLSGRPLRDKAVATVAAVRRQVGKEPIIIGCGGIFTGRDAWQFQDAGADLFEGFTGFIYEGPFYCRNVLGGLRSDSDRY